VGGGWVGGERRIAKITRRNSRVLFHVREENLFSHFINSIDLAGGFYICLSARGYYDFDPKAFLSPRFVYLSLLLCRHRQSLSLSLALVCT
jgi:hypothetical protein